MTLGRYLLGLLLLGGILTPLAVASVRIRAWLIPDWSGAQARLAECVLVLAALLGVAHLLGTVGVFAIGPLVAVCVIVGSAASIVAGRKLRGLRPRPLSAAWVPRAHPGEIALAVAAASLAAGLWVTWVAQSSDFGIGNGDTVWYHLPFAARFVQEGSITALQFVNGEALVSYYPADASVLHAIGFLAFGSDALSLVLNLLVLPFWFLAAWCFGRRFGVGPACVVAAALIAALPVMATSQPGTGKDDALSLALLLAAAAMLVNLPGRNYAAVGVSGLAAGMALGTKLTMLAPVAILLVCVLFLARRGLRGPVTAVWASCAFAAGGFWYVRNLIAAGNPIPSLGFQLPSPPTPSIDRYGSAIAEHLVDPDAVGRVIGPGFEQAFGPAWAVVIVVALAGALWATVRGIGTVRIAGAGAIITGVAYLLTPGTAFAVDATGLSSDGKRAVVFILAYNLRYLAPALMLGLALFPMIRPLRRSGLRWVPIGVLSVLVLVTETSGVGRESWSTGHAGVAIATMVALPVAVVAYQRLGSLAIPILATSVALLMTVGAWTVLRGYDARRYSLFPASAWLERIHDRRIAVGGFVVQFPFAGDDLSNFVQYVGKRGPTGSFAPYRSCIAWRRALRAGDFDYVVTPSDRPVPALGYDLSRWRLGNPLGEPPRPAPETAWTRSDPNVDLIVESGGASVYRVRPGVQSTGCADPD